jgi:hypothetical protein
MIKGKVDCALNDSVIIHFHKITLAKLLIFGNEIFAVSAADLQKVAASDFDTIRVFENCHLPTLISAAFS